ncbi:hypothetical protein MtrunA17_Chr4g0066751 [Medicago truncatula]|uniref:Uncharacterized protein n=1 Tax=Medicago truncatula TaxID=3880 RepID=A0A396IHS5_MEDTR|nr:hypothetical protein MtrunA17_Chr4g0066751 [Medicago truncatula]
MDSLPVLVRRALMELYSERQVSSLYELVSLFHHILDFPSLPNE